MAEREHTEVESSTEAGVEAIAALVSTVAEISVAIVEAERMSALSPEECIALGRAGTCCHLGTAL